MKALYFENGQLSYLDNYPKPVPDEDQALIRVSLAGICSTDLEVLKGYSNFAGVLGHEFVGVVEAAAGAPSLVGKRVVGGINLGCGVCQVCLTSGPEHCPDRKVLGIKSQDGAFAEYIVLPVQNLVVVPDHLPDQSAVFAEPLAAALRITVQIELDYISSAAVVGPGRLGLLSGLVLAEKGVQVTMLGRRQASLELPQKLGLQTGLAEETAGSTFDLVVEATGNEAGLVQALRLVRPSGVLMMKSTFSGKTTVDLTRLVVAEITVIGSRCGPIDDAINLLADNKIPVQEMIDGRFSLEEGLQAFSRTKQPGIRKVLIRP